MESEKGFPEWQYDIKMEILDIIQRFNPDHLTLACDGHNLWRKKIFPAYKENRKAGRAEIPIDWDMFGKVRDILLAEFEKHVPVRTILLDGVEADDIVATLTEKLHETQEIIALTNDKDWHQLFKYPNYRVFKLFDLTPNAYYNRSPEGRIEVTGVDPVRLIQMKILTGDTSDNIPNLKPRLGEKTAEKIIASCEGNIYEYCRAENLLEAFERNQRLINLDRVPQDIKDTIWDSYNSKKPITVDHLLLSEFYGENYDLIAATSHLHMFSNRSVKNLGW